MKKQVYLAFAALTSVLIAAVSYGQGTINVNIDAGTVTQTGENISGCAQQPVPSSPTNNYSYLDGASGSGSLPISTRLINLTSDQGPDGGPFAGSYPCFNLYVVSYENGPINGTFELFYPVYQGSGQLQVNVNVTGTAVFPTTVVDPLYKIVSILYATPGNKSSDSFLTSQTSGTVTSIGSSTQVGTSDTFSYGFVGGSAGITFGASATTGNSTAFTETIADASSISNASSTSGANTIDHNQDLILVWLNPEVTLTSSSSNANDITYSVAPRSGQPSDIVEVTAETMQNVAGATNIPLYQLQMQFDAATGLNDLPGLAAICADQSQYANNCSQGGQCGCVPSDFVGVLASDPLVSSAPAGDANTNTNPMSVDSSGVQACVNLTPSSASQSGCRYVEVPATTNSPIQMDQILEGPACSGCNTTTNAYTQNDSTSTTMTLSESNSESVGYTLKAGGGVGPSLQSSTTFTWTDSESTGEINGQSNQIGYSLSSSTVDCGEYILVYEDTVFHTFVTQAAPGNNNSCP